MLPPKSLNFLLAAGFNVKPDCIALVSKDGEGGYINLNSVLGTDSGKITPIN